MRIPMIAVALLLATTAAEAGGTYTVDRWPQDADSIPCSAWDHLPDGSWALKGYVKLGASVIDNIGFNKGDPSARMLERKCGKT